MMSKGKTKHLPKMTLVALAAMATTACTPPDNIFTPVSGTDFNASTGTVVIQGLTASTSVCYTTDGSNPVWNGGTCIGGSTQRIPGPVAFAQIALACDGDTGSSVPRTIKVLYDWSGTPGYTQSANYFLDCGGSGGGDTGGGDTGGGDTGGGDTGGGDTGGGSNPQNLTLTPAADAYVDQSSSSQNFGADSTLLVDLDPDVLHTYMRFNVPTLTANLQSATLRLYGTNATPNGPKIYTTSNSWNEDGITWNNKPSANSTLIADMPQTSTGWVDIDVTSAISGSGSVSLVMIPDDTDGYDFSSREGSNPPQLIVVTGDGSTGGGDTGGGDTGGGSSADNSNTMVVGDYLNNNENLESSNGAYRFYLQGDGNLVLRDWATRDSMWSSGTHGDNGTQLRLQSDGNLVLYTDTNSPVWSSQTVGSGADRLVLEDDGTLALYQGSNAVWSVGGSGGGDTGGGDTGGGSGSITHIGTTETYDSNGQNVTIARPSGSSTGDLLVLFLHRTDDYLQLNEDGWNRAAQCYKRDNGYNCVAYEDCTSWLNSDFCQYFGDYGRSGHDLAQSVFYKRVNSGEPSSYTFNMNPDSNGHPGWIILTALRGANTSDPIRDWANEGCDNNSDSLFPSVYGVAGDMVLLSQSFDDAIAQSKFNPPDNTTSFGYVSQSDEAGFLFGGTLSSTGETGPMKTHGDGGPNCKDALISITIKPQ